MVCVCVGLCGFTVCGVLSSVLCVCVVLVMSCLCLFC